MPVLISKSHYHLVWATWMGRFAGMQTAGSETSFLGVSTGEFMKEIGISIKLTVTHTCRHHPTGWGLNRTKMWKNGQFSLCLSWDVHLWLSDISVPGSKALGLTQQLRWFLDLQAWTNYSPGFSSSPVHRWQLMRLISLQTVSKFLQLYFTQLEKLIYIQVYISIYLVLSIYLSSYLFLLLFLSGIWLIN